VNEHELVDDQRDHRVVLGGELSIERAPCLLTSSLVSDEDGRVDLLVEVGVVEPAVVLTRTTRVMLMRESNSGGMSVDADG